MNYNNGLFYLSIIQSRTMSVCPSVCLKLKISVTAESIWFYSSGNIPSGSVVVLGCFLMGWDTPLPRKKYERTILYRRGTSSRGEAASHII